MTLESSSTRWLFALLLFALTALVGAGAYLGYLPRMAVAAPLAVLTLYVVAWLASAPARAAWARRR